MILTLCLSKKNCWQKEPKKSTRPKKTNVCILLFTIHVICQTTRRQKICLFRPMFALAAGTFQNNRNPNTVALAVRNHVTPGPGDSSRDRCGIEMLCQQIRQTKVIRKRTQRRRRRTEAGPKKTKKKKKKKKKKVQENCVKFSSARCGACSIDFQTWNHSRGPP